MSVVASTIIPASSDATISDLWGVPALFRAQWSSGVTIRTSWATDVAYARSGAAMRTGLRNRPVRTVEFDLLGLTADDMRLLRATLARLGSARILCPLYPDAVRLTATATGSTLACDTRWRRFAPGARVIVAEMAVGQASAARYEVATIDSFDEESITLAATLAGSWPSGSVVMPLIEGEASLDGSISGTTDQIAAARLIVRETVGTSALPATAAGNVTPDGFDEFATLPIFDVRPDRGSPVSLGWDRPIEREASGITTVSSARDSRPRTTCGFIVTAMDRASAWRVMQFFDSRRGRLHPFILPSPLAELSPESRSGYTTVVRAVGQENDWDFFPLLAVMEGDGVWTIGTITGVVRSSGNDTITTTQAIGSGVDSFGRGRFTTAALVAFATDELVEQWVTDETVTFSLRFREHVEKSVVVDVDDVTSGDAGVSPSCGATPADAELSDATGLRLINPCTDEEIEACIEEPSGDVLAVFDPTDELYYFTGDTVSLAACERVLTGYEEMELDQAPGEINKPVWVQSCNCQEVYYVSYSIELNEGGPVFGNNVAVTFNPDLNRWEAISGTLFIFMWMIGTTVRVEVGSTELVPGDTDPFVRYEKSGLSCPSDEAFERPDPVLVSQDGDVIAPVGSQVACYVSKEPIL